MSIFLHYTLLFSLTCFIPLSLSARTSPPVAYSSSKEYLAHRISSRNMRYQSFIMALDMLRDRHAKTLVETGTARSGDFNGDGGSTIIFGDWASRNNALLYSVDISQQHIDNARKLTKDYVNSGHLQLVCSDSVEFLVNFDAPIDFLYLDSFDYEWGNPKPSQEHHLKEVMAAYPYLHQESFIMIDDCTLPEGGKGKLVIEFLKEKGWKIVYDGYQVILSQ